MSKFLEHNSSGWNGSGRTSKNINVHQSKSSGNVTVTMNALSVMVYEL